MTFTIDRAQLHEHKPHHFTCEASDLQLKPGCWPSMIVVKDLGNGQPLFRTGFTRLRGEVASAEYAQQLGVVSLSIFND